MKALLSGLLGNPWVFVALAAIAFSGGYYTSHQFDKAAQLDAVEKAEKAKDKAYADRDADFAKTAAHDQKVTADNAKLRTDLSTKELALLEALSAAPLTTIVTKVIHDDKGDHSCSMPTRGDNYRLCINAAYAGDAATIGACKAAGGYGDLPSERVPPAS